MNNIFYKKIYRNNYILFLFLLFSIATLSSCKLKVKQNKKHNIKNADVVASGQKLDTILKTNYFTGLDVSGVTEVELSQDTTLLEPVVQVVGDKNFVNNLELNVKNNVLKISLKNDVNVDLDEVKFELKVKMNKINYLEVSGAANLKTTSQIACEDLELNLSGIGGMEIDCKVNELNSDVSGTGKLDIKGIANRHVSEISGIGGIDAFGLLTNVTDVKVSGTGGADVNATDSLQASVSGIGSVKYKGTPKFVHKDISGMGEVELE